MKVVDQLPPHILHVEQAGAKYAHIYAAIAELEKGGALHLEKSDVNAPNFKNLVDAAHSVVGSANVRKTSRKHYSLRRDHSDETVYIVRNK